MTKLWHLYEIDLDGEIVYVGTTNNFASRKSQHRVKRMVPFIGTHMRSVQTFERREDALKAEMQRIRELKPKFNMVGNPSGPATRADQSRIIYETEIARETKKWRKLREDVERDMAEHPERYVEFMKKYGK
jgi:predicted GIY-YIG superfamily endonuclease